MPSAKASKRLRSMADQIQQSTQVVEQKYEIIQDPLPEPEMLERYKNAGPTFPERIMKIAEAHNSADIKTKNRISLSSLIVPIIGQVFTLALGAGGILACIYLARLGLTAPAIASVACGFSPIVINALRGLRKQ